MGQLITITDSIKSHSEANIDVIKSLLEFYGQAIKQVNENNLSISSDLLNVSSAIL